MEKNREWNTSFAGSIIKIALPVTLQSMLRSSFSMVDQVMIGQLGSESIAGIGLGGKFASMQSVILGAVTAAAAVMISQYMGQQNLKKCKAELLCKPSDSAWRITSVFAVGNCFCRTDNVLLYRGYVFKAACRAVFAGIFLYFSAGSYFRNSGNHAVLYGGCCIFTVCKHCISYDQHRA